MDRSILVGQMTAMRTLLPFASACLTSAFTLDLWQDIENGQCLHVVLLEPSCCDQLRIAMNDAPQGNLGLSVLFFLIASILSKIHRAFGKSGKTGPYLARR